MLAYGLEKFVCDAVDAGADGFIVPDLPIEETDEFHFALSGVTQQGSADEARVVNGNRASSADFARNAPSSAQRDRLPLIQMLAPTTPDDRMEGIARSAKGFIYLVSVTGVTGERKSISEGLSELILRVRERTSVPVCVGFGISTPEQAKEVGEMADGVIVGSACVKTIGGSETPVETAKQFAREFQQALQELRK
jgi:tryptophan synthase alpha chain